MTVLDAISAGLIGLGSVFVLIGALGLLRLPDIFTRVHGASVLDTAGAALMLVGMMLQAGASLVTVKLAFLLAIFLFTLPVAGHALARAALQGGLAPRLARDRRPATPPADAGERR